MNWIIAITNTDPGSAVVERVSGTKTQVKKYIFNMAREDWSDDPDDYETKGEFKKAMQATYAEYGIDSIDKIEEDPDDGKLSLTVFYGEDGEHSDYIAIPEPDTVKPLGKPQSSTFFIVVDNSKCGKGDAYDSKYQQVLERFDSLEAAVKWANKNTAGKRDIEIEEWDGENFVASFNKKGKI